MKRINLSIFALLFVFGTALSAKECLADENQTESKGFSISPFFQEINLAKDQEKGDFVLEIAASPGNLTTAAAGGG